MDQGHSHDHTHGRPDEGHGQASHSHAHSVAPSRIGLVLALQLGYMLVEVAGGYWTHSLALLADAGHMATDASALALVLVAGRIAKRPPNAQFSFGWRRAEALAAFLNAAALVLVGVGIAVEALERLSSAEPILAPAMLGIAAGGLAVNLAGIALLGTPHQSDINARGAWLHLASDALGSVAAMIAAGLIWATGFGWPDPVVSGLVALLVLRSAWGLLRDAAYVLMEAVPAHVDISALRAALLAVPGVQAVHDVHIWTLARGQLMFTAHVVSDLGPAEVLPPVRAVVLTQLGGAHITVQVEPPGFVEGTVCE